MCLCLPMFTFAWENGLTRELDSELEKEEGRGNKSECIWQDGPRLVASPQSQGSAQMVARRGSRSGRTNEGGSSRALEVFQPSTKATRPKCRSRASAVCAVRCDVKENPCELKSAHPMASFRLGPLKQSPQRRSISTSQEEASQPFR